MILEIEHNLLYANGLFICYVGAGNGRKALQPRSCEVRTAFSHALQKVLPYADGYGWLGADSECDLVLGKIRGSDGPIPCDSCVSRVVAMVDQAESIGERVVLIIDEV